MDIGNQPVYIIDLNTLFKEIGNLPPEQVAMLGYIDNNGDIRSLAQAQIEKLLLEARIDELKELAITPHIADELKDAVAPYYLRRARELTKLLEKK